MPRFVVQHSFPYKFLQLTGRCPTLSLQHPFRLVMTQLLRGFDWQLRLRKAHLLATRRHNLPFRLRTHNDGPAVVHLSGLRGHVGGAAVVTALAGLGPRVLVGRLVGGVGLVGRVGRQVGGVGLLVGGVGRLVGGVGRLVGGGGLVGRVGRVGRLVGHGPMVWTLGSG
uniref:Uncharacterized protein n=1 Tax=Zeugodacus cucurbitae TaxID=28588 RepID=A0A0A1WTP6_ZEUCU